jgi:hypothetical protein
MQDELAVPDGLCWMLGKGRGRGRGRQRGKGNREARAGEMGLRSKERGRIVIKRGIE